MKLQEHKKNKYNNFITKAQTVYCFNNNKLKFDFYIPEQNLLIGFDGESHFREVKHLGGKKGFQLRQKNDKIKKRIL